MSDCRYDISVWLYCWRSEWTAPSQPYYWWKTWLVSLWNVRSEEQAQVSSGRLFQARIAATGKARSPTVARWSMAPAVSWCQQSGDSDSRRSLMWAAGCQTGTPVLCYAHNGTPEHTTRTGFVPGRVTSEAPVAVGLCVLTSGTSRQAKRRHSARTAGPTAVRAEYRGTHKDRVTLIQLGDDQCSDQCQQGVLRERPSHATVLKLSLRHSRPSTHTLLCRCWVYVTVGPVHTLYCVDFNESVCCSSIRLIWKCRSTVHHWFYQRNPFL